MAHDSAKPSAPDPGGADHEGVGEDLDEELDDALDWGPRRDDTEYRARESHPVGDEASPREPGVWLTALLGGIYVMWALAWVIGLASQPTPQLSSGLETALYRFGEFLAYIATPLWFAVALWVGTNWSPRMRGGFLLLGLILLLPWPFLLPVVLA